jgi:hypothetical protein
MSMEAAESRGESWGESPSLFADLPLHEFVESRRARGRSHLLRTDALGPTECLGLVAANRLLAATPCTRADGWIYKPDSMAFASARDTSLCLDVFDGATLGAYWCHGGPNQQFKASATPAAATYCHDGRFCVSIAGDDAHPGGGGGGPVLWQGKEELR